MVNFGKVNKKFFNHCQHMMSCATSCNTASVQCCCCSV